MVLLGSTLLIEGSAASIDGVLALLRAEGIRTEGNPDLYVRAYAHFGVDEAREIIERSSLRASGERRVFVLAMPVMTGEAQNALLKTLEEAPGDALFCLIVPAPHALLPTVRSRAQIASVDAETAPAALDARAFLASRPQERLEMLKPLLEKGDDERRDIGGLVMLLSSLERLLSQDGVRAADADGLRAIYRARQHVTEKGALVKPLLEHVALLVPSMKT